VTIRDELAVINADFGRALAEQDVDGILAHYADEARMLFHGRPIIRGRAAIEATVRGWLEDGPIILRFETDEVIADGSLVVDIGSNYGPSGRSKYVVVYQRQSDGSLKIAVDAASSDGASPT